MGRIAWAAAVVFKQTGEIRKYENYLNTLDLDIVHIEAVSRAQRAQMTKIVDQEADFLQDVYFNENIDKPEARLEKIKTTIQVLISLL